MSSPLGKFWTVANLLSMLRAALAIPVTYLILTNGPIHWILGLILAAVLTDWFDGHLARWSHTVSDWGKVLDPLADKIAALAVSVALVIRGSLPAWFIGFVLVRDVVIVLGGVLIARRTGQVMMSIWWGKLGVTALAMTILAALLQADPPVLRFCIWLTFVLMLYAFVRYGLRFRRVWNAGWTPARGGPDPESSSSVSTLKQQTG